MGSGSMKAHYDEDGADDHGLDASSEDRICDNRKRFIHNHVGQEESNEKQMAILTDGQDSLGVFALLPELCKGPDSMDVATRTGYRSDIGH